MRTTMIIVSMILASCGQQQANEESSSVEMAPAAQKQTSIQPMVETQVQQGMFRFNSVKEMPVCDESRVGMIAYAKDTNEFFSCEDGEWFEIDLSGDDGTDGINGVGQQGVQGIQGQQGQQGIQGQAGTNGIDNHIVTRWECEYAITDNVAYFATWTGTVRYAINKMESGDIHAMYSMLTQTGEFKANVMYPATHPKAATAELTYRYNLLAGPDAGDWTFTLNQSNDTLTINYQDDEMINLGGVYQRTTVCTKTSY